MPTKFLQIFLLLFLIGLSTTVLSQEKKASFFKNTQLGLQLNASRALPVYLPLVYPRTDSNFPFTGVGGEFILRKPLNNRLSLNMGLGFDYTFKRVSRIEVEFYNGTEFVPRAYNLRQYTYAIELPVLLDYSFIQQENFSLSLQAGAVFSWISQDDAEETLSNNAAPNFSGTWQNSARDILFPDVRVGLIWKQIKNGLVNREIGVNVQWPLEESLSEFSSKYRYERRLYNSPQLSLQYTWFPAFLNKGK